MARCQSPRVWRAAGGGAPGQLDHHRARGVGVERVRARVREELEAPAGGHQRDGRPVSPSPRANRWHRPPVSPREARALRPSPAPKPRGLGRAPWVAGRAPTWLGWATAAVVPTDGAGVASRPLTCSQVGSPPIGAPPRIASSIEAASAADWCRPGRRTRSRGLSEVTMGGCGRVSAPSAGLPKAVHGGCRPRHGPQPLAAPRRAPKGHRARDTYHAETVSGRAAPNGPAESANPRGHGQLPGHREADRSAQANGAARRGRYRVDEDGRTAPVGGGRRAPAGGAGRGAPAGGPGCLGALRGAPGSPPVPSKASRLYRLEPRSFLGLARRVTHVLHSRPPRSGLMAVLRRGPHRALQRSLALPWTEGLLACGAG